MEHIDRRIIAERLDATRLTLCEAIACVSQSREGETLTRFFEAQRWCREPEGQIERIKLDVECGES